MNIAIRTRYIGPTSSRGAHCHVARLTPGGEPPKTLSRVWEPNQHSEYNHRVTALALALYSSNTQPLTLHGPAPLGPMEFLWIATTETHHD
jgi:hypothetical protein